LDPVVDPVVDRAPPHTAASFATHEVLIGGHWQAGFGGEHIGLLNPSTGEHLAHVARGTAADINAAVQAAQAALHGPWGHLTAAERGRFLMQLSHAVLAEVESLAHLEALDVGKPLAQGRADARALARYLEFYGGAADKLMGQTLPTAAGQTAFTWHEPHGVTAHIVPWNYPMQIIGRSAGAALAMGNACVLKPAEEACLTALAFARLFTRVAAAGGWPVEALNVVPGLGEEAGAALAAHAGVQHISFTGSVAVGRQIQAAAAQNLVPVTLELGGKSPQLVFADADLDEALPWLVNAGIQNAGQTCSAASRILVQRAVFESVMQRMSDRYAALRVAPALADGDVGPLISARQRASVMAYLALVDGQQVSRCAAATLPADLPAGGFYVPPTLVQGRSAQHRLAQEEVFGPLQLLLPFEDEDEAVALANGTPFGLVAGVWTRDGNRALRLARRRRRRRAALWRRQTLRPWPRKGFRGAAGSFHHQNLGLAAWLSPDRGC
jgi:aldehyde dehydrogenase (NAD+)